MLILNGILRQSGEITKKDDPKAKFAKLWIEHETPRPNGPADLEILEMMIPADKVTYIPPKGKEISIRVRAYPRGNSVGFQALGILTGTDKK